MEQNTSHLLDLKQGQSPLILASGSKTRAELLRNAGISCNSIKPCVDEEAVKLSALEQGLRNDDIATLLAEMKAQQVGQMEPEAWVLGCDQTLSLEGQLFDKPKDQKQLCAQLHALSGKKHKLFSAAVIFYRGQRIWHALGMAQLEMRVLSETFIQAYADKMAQKALLSVGGYQIEGLGAQLFTRVEGDPYTIMGLPLLQLSAYLREHQRLLA